MSRPSLSLNAILSHATLWIGLVLLIMALAFGFGVAFLAGVFFFFLAF